MANTSRVNGFRVVGTNGQNGVTGKTTLFYVASAADEILVGDIAKVGSASDANGIPGADLAGATDVPIGVVVAVMHSKFDPAGKLTTGSTALDLPAGVQIAASGTGYILVNTDPQVILEAEVNTAGTAFAATDVGMNVRHANGTRTASTITSPAAVDAAVTPAVTATYMFQLMGFVRRVDNEIGASARVLLRFNVHQYQSVGTLGIA